MRSSSAVLAVALVALVAVGCGEDKKGSVKISDAGTSTSGTAPTATTELPPVGHPVATLKVKETDFKLTPAQATVAQPGVVLVEATNAGRTTHAIEIEGPNGEVKSQPIAPGKKRDVKVDLSKDGSYVWYCPIADHKARGMKGTITVGNGGKKAATGAGNATRSY